MDEKPSAAAAEAQPSAQPAPKSAEKLTPSQLVAKHIGDVSKLTAAQLPDNHLLVQEHAEAAQLKPWQMRALLARFHAEGLTALSRIHPDVFKAALDATLHGRI